MAERKIELLVPLDDADDALFTEILQRNGIDPADFLAAAAEEYVRMVLGQSAFTRGSDILEYRLFLLIKHVLNGAVPRERFVSDIFQITRGRARTLIASVLSKYQYELRAGVAGALTEMLNGAAENEQVYKKPYLVFRADSDAKVQMLNDLVREHDLDERIKPAGRPGLYRLLPSVKEALVKALQ